MVRPESKSFLTLCHILYIRILLLIFKSVKDNLVLGLYVSWESMTNFSSSAGRDIFNLF